MMKEEIIILEINNIIDFIKMYFISSFTFYLSLRLINYKKYKKIDILCIQILQILICSIYIFIRDYIPFFGSIFLLIITLSIGISKCAKRKISYSIFITIVSISINYVIFLVSTSIVYIINYILKINDDKILLIIILGLYVIFIYRFMKIKKICKGFAFIQNNLFLDYFTISNLNISMIIIFTITLFRNCDKSNNKLILLELSGAILVMVITIKKSFELYYKQKLLIKDLDETKEELAKTKEELAKAEKENLEASKRSHSLVHRQKALEFQISELTKNKNSKDINKIKQDVENLSKELYGKEVMTQLSKTNIELIDNMFRYMQFECYKNEIRFDLQICGNIYKMINNVINKETLEILLADHIKNAIIAVKHSENSNKSILVKLGKIGDCYGVCIYDSGIEFKEETFKTLGKKPSSTHLDEGGSGMGFLNTFDTLNKYKASLIIDEIGMPCEENYTKVIMIKFDGKNEFKVNSYRQQKAV